jgi:hypothetical protein
MPLDPVPVPRPVPLRVDGPEITPRDCRGSFLPLCENGSPPPAESLFCSARSSRRASFDRNSHLAAVEGSYASSVGQAASLSPCPMFHRASESGTGARRASWQLALRNQPPGFVAGPVPLKMCLRRCPDGIFPAQRESHCASGPTTAECGDVEIRREMLDKTTRPVPVPCPVPSPDRQSRFARAHTRRRRSALAFNDLRGRRAQGFCCRSKGAHRNRPRNTSLFSFSHKTVF